VSFVRTWSILTLILAALSLAPSFAHLLEAPPRLRIWPQSLWIETTVMHGQFTLFRNIGGPLDILAIVAAAVLAWLTRDTGAWKWAAAGALFLALALAVWFLRVAPANTTLAAWAQGAPPVNFEAVRNRWEGGHMIAAALKAVGLVLIALAVVPVTRPPATIL
jgi:hypothetical protein